MKARVILLLVAFVVSKSSACIWDAKTIMQEKWSRPDLAKVILHNEPEKPDVKKLRAHLAELNTSPQKSDASWWNEVAGTHLRLGEAKQAAELLEKVLAQFPNDYGIHANLGTAYHLLGRYVDAEREIARDLDINPDAHFGLEKYHLALLQYLVRDVEYQKRHVYVDEWTWPFIDGRVRYSRPTTHTNEVNSEELTAYKDLIKTEPTNYWAGRRLLALQSQLDAPPPYRKKWDLGGDPKFEEGILYMASLNPKQPACSVMLGIHCWRMHKYNLAAAAFRKAVELGSPQSELLKNDIGSIEHYIWSSHRETAPLYAAGAAIVLAIVWYLISLNRRLGRKRAQARLT
jgi:hypothetical protein